MEQPIVFALTPRAGQWNHRYLVPRESCWPQEVLSRLADRAREKPHGFDYVSASRKVSQPTTGRIGLELLVLHDDRLKSRGRSIVSEALCEALEQQMSKLDELVVKKIDWEAEGTHLVVECAELNQWRETLVRQLSVSGFTESSNQNGRRIVLTVSSIFLLLTVLVLAFIWLPRNGQTEPQQNRLAHTSAAISPEKLGDLSGILGIPVTDTTESLAARVAEKLATDLFSDERQEPKAQNSPEARIQETLKRLYRAVYRKETDENLEKLLADQGLILNLKKLYPQSQFDSNGLLAEEHSTLGLQKMSAASFHDVIRLISNLQKVIEDVTPPLRADSDDLYEQLFAAMRLNYANTFHRTTGNGDIHRRFYIHEDVELAKRLFNLLDEPALLRLRDAESNPDGLVDKLHELAKEYNSPGSQLSQDGLNFQKRRFRDSTPQRIVFEHLDTLLRTCAAQFKDVGNAGTPTEGATRSLPSSPKQLKQKHSRQ